MSMKATVVRATPWTAASTLTGMVCQLLQVAVLARVLTPHEYGVAAAAVVVNAFFQVFLGAGLAPAIVQRTGVTRNELQSVHWVNLLFAGVMTVIGVVASPLIADGIGVVDAQPVILVASFTFLVAALGQVPQAVMEKRLDFRGLAIAEVIAGLVLLGSSVAAALNGAGAFAVPIGLISGELARALIYLWSARADYVPGLHFAPRETKRFVSFGLVTTLDVMLNFWSANIASLATGRFLGARSLGGYNLAITLGYSMPGRINPIVTRILFPALASIQDDLARVRRGYLNTVQLLGAVNFLGLGFIAVSATPLVTIFYGERWTWIASTASLICVAGMLRALGFPMGPLLAALDHIKLGFAVNIVKTALALPTSIWLTARFGLVGAAWSMVVTQMMSMVISAWLLRRILQVSPLTYSRVLLDCLVFAAVPIGGAWLCSTAMDSLQAWAQILVLGLVTAALSAVIVIYSPLRTAVQLRELVFRQPTGRHRARVS